MAHKKKLSGALSSFITFESNFLPLFWPSYSQCTHSIRRDAGNISQRWWCLQVLTTHASNKRRLRYSHSLM